MSKTRCALAASVGLLVGLTVPTPAQIPAASASPQAAAAPTPAAEWRFDEGTGATAADDTGPGNAMTLQGGATWGAGRIGAHALSLTGAEGCFADVPKPVIDTAQSYTVTAWVKVRALKGFQTVVSEDGEEVSCFYLQLRGDTGGFAFTVMPSDMVQDAAIAKATAPAKADVWYFIAGVHDVKAHTVALYIDGVAQQTVPMDTPWHATGHTAVGRALFSGNPVDFVNGQIDDVRLYQSALSAADVLALDKAAPPVAPTSPASPPTVGAQSGPPARTP